MTSRAKPVTRPRKDRLGAGERRNLLMTIGFGAAIGFAILMLLAAVGRTWYDDHMATMLSVNGQGVSRDFFRQAVAVERFRIDQEEARVRALVPDRMTATEGDSRITALGTQRQSVGDDTNTKLLDGMVQTDLAKDQGVEVTDADVDKAWTAEATTAEMRDAYLISVAPGKQSGATTSTQAEIDAARKTIDGIKAKLDAGQSWDDVMKTTGADATTGTSVDSTNGSIGWVTSGSTAADPKTIEAIFALPENGVTPVIEAADGSFEIGHVKAIDAAKVDPDFAKKVADAGLDTGVYRTLLRYELIAKALQDKVVATAVDQPSDQRSVSEIRLDSAQGTGDEVRVRHILFSPGGDPSKVSDFKPDDPEWVKAKNKADALYQSLKAGNITFTAAAKDSNDTGSAADGGLLPWLTQDSVVTEFGDAIFAPGLKAGDVLAPVKTQYGWHVIQYEGRRPPPDQLIKTIRTETLAQGGDFAALAKQYSDASNAADGGKLGWVAKYQLPEEQETVIFATPAGGVSDVVSAQDGYYIFKVDEQATRVPDVDQATTIRQNAFPRWYAPLRSEAKIEQVATPLQVLGTQQQP